MNIIFEKVLQQYKKCNSAAKAKMLTKYGFDSEEKFLQYLNAETILKASEITSPTEKPVIHVVDILDTSASMRGEKFNSAKAGVNSQIAKLKEDKDVIYTHTLTVFKYPSSVNNLYFKKEIDKVGEFMGEPDSNTPLYHAIGETLEKLISTHNGKDKVLVNILTDGQENASRGKYASSKAVQSLISQCEEKGFTITFIGTKQDVEYIKKKLSVDDSNTFVHENTGDSISFSYMARTNAMSSYKDSVLKGEDVTKGFYKKTGKL